MTSRQKIQGILERARWAPSGDNGQPWEFEITDAQTLIVHVLHETRNVYEFGKGRPSWIAAGALLENMSLAAAASGTRASVLRVQDFVEDRGLFEVGFADGGDVPYDDLEKYIETRSVLRSSYKAVDIPPPVLGQLERAVGPRFKVKWFAALPERWAITRLNMQATRIRLSIPETYHVHKNVIDWKNRHSPDKMPASSLGMSRMTMMMSRWAMKSPERVSFLMKYMGGTVMPRLEMDIFPGLFCARHFMLLDVSGEDSDSAENCLSLGRALQRFWLCATKNGLVMQPGMAPKMFAFCDAQGITFTTSGAMQKAASVLRRDMERIAGVPVAQVAVCGRIGFPKEPLAEDRPRSIRKPLSELLLRE